MAAAVGALAGAQVGYLIGRRVGPGLLDRPDRPRLQQGVPRARAALDRYGAAKAIVLARSIPLVDRYLLPIVAVIVVVSLIPVAVEMLRSRAHSR